MLSYRHAFHAGNAADVLKHGLLVFVLDYLGIKPKPLYLLDTHAGAGRYDLASEWARKTNEAEAGILRLLKAPGPAPALFDRYRDQVRACLEGEGFYPGSAHLLADGCRDGDRLDLVELHPADHEALQTVMAGKRGIRVLKEDGLGALTARLPPPERRGLTVIDPSYEVKTDYDEVPGQLIRAHKRFATGTYLLWYPVIDRARTETTIDQLRQSGIRNQFRFELCWEEDREARGMTGSGVVLINPPYTLAAAAPEGLAWLERALATRGLSKAEWLVPE